MRKRSRETQANKSNRNVNSALVESTETDFVMERFGRIKDADRSFDFEYWQRQGDAAIYRAAWELIEFYHRQQGMKPDELRLQRSIESFQRA
jgi:hypothetical protein